MDLINKGAFETLCKQYKLTKIDKYSIECVEEYLLEIIEKRIPRQILSKDDDNYIAKHEKKRKREKSDKTVG